MKRNVSTCILGLLAAIGFLLTLPAAAHPVTTSDKSRADWFAKGPSQANIGAIARDTTGRGEFVWTDAKGDQRVIDPANPDVAREADLTRFSVTADATNISFLAKVDRYSGISNNPALQIMISIDSDATHTAGQTALPNGVATNIASAAAWERVIETQFVPGGQQGQSVSAAPKVYSSLSSSTTVGTAQLVSASSSVTQGSFAEIQVPWSAIGGMPTADHSLRFTVSTYYADHSAPNDSSTSKAIDVIGSNAAGTLAELGSDATIKSYFDLHFSATGEVFAPLLISEFLPDPPTNNDPKGEWIELYNPNSFGINLNGYKLGDQAYRGGSQGMLVLPNYALGVGQAVVIANDRATFQARYPSVPSTSIIEMNTLASYTAWASGKISLQNQNSGAAFKESLALLDGRDTIVDLVQYAYKTPLGPTGLDPDNKPIVLSGPAVTPNASYDRCPSGSDTNDSNNDFFVRDSSTPDRAPTPGVACTTVPGIDLRISKNGPESVEVLAGPAVTTVQYLIPFSNAGANTASNVVITDTLPVGLSLNAQQATAGVTFGGVNGQTLSWTLASLTPTASGVITLTATVDPSTPQDTQLTNSVGISSTPSEAPATLSNNVATQTVITGGPADLTVNSTWAQANGTAPGQQFSYTITYINLGENDANDITITDVLPANVTVVSSSVPTANGATSGTLTWNVSSLEYRESGDITLLVKVNNAAASGQVLQHTLSIASNPVDLNRADEQPDSAQEALTLGNRKVYMSLIFK